METVRFHIAQMSFFIEDSTHLVVQTEQCGSLEKLSWGFMFYIDFYVLYLYLWLLQTFKVHRTATGKQENNVMK